jgi:gamma-glutamylcyclotransferase (GGCT)/AIG2-like uncharacterized protein YtfP
VNLFVYGSLMSDAVWRNVARTVCPAIPATARGWEVRAIRAVSYPGLIPAAPDSIASGLVRTNVPADALERLDAFEGSFYDRITLKVQTSDGVTFPADAWIVAPRGRHEVLSTPWDAHRFFSEQLRDFVAQFCSPDSVG